MGGPGSGPGGRGGVRLRDRGGLIRRGGRRRGGTAARHGPDGDGAEGGLGAADEQRPAPDPEAHARQGEGRENGQDLAGGAAGFHGGTWVTSGRAGPTPGRRWPRPSRSGWRSSRS